MCSWSRRRSLSTDEWIHSFLMQLYGVPRLLRRRRVALAVPTLDSVFAYGRWQAALSGALALLFDRAAALFGTKAAAAERHSATMRRCIFKIARRAAILPSVVTSFGFGVRARAKIKREIGRGGRRETSLGGSRAVMYGVVVNTTPLAAVARETPPPARGWDGQ